ncbi:MAG: ABC transporter substrate-binding protein [Clostridia bacterium]|nr:ABC transporter substrate-binding protein [Clostridia bacterium]
MKRLTALLLALALLLSLAGCAGGGQGSGESGPTLTDGDGRTVALPEDGGAVKIASVYGTAVPFLVALDLSEQVVAVNCKSNFWKTAVPALAEAGTVGRGVVDLEALAQCGAGVLVHRSNDDETVQAVEELGIPVLCIRAEDLEGVYSTLRLMGDYFGRAERAKEVIDWMDGKFAAIDAITATIPEDERPTALVMGGELGRIAGGDMIQSWMIEKAGGIAVAAEVENDAAWINVGVETVFQWDPEYLFCTSSASLDYTVEEILQDPAWNASAAVISGHVAQIPARIDTWDMPGIAAVLSTFWMLHQMHPDLFSREQLEAEIEEYYTFMFGQTFSPEYLGYTL